MAPCESSSASLSSSSSSPSAGVPSDEGGRAPKPVSVARSSACGVSSSSPPAVAFTATAYSKMVMHAAKHTQDAVNGVLLGRLLPANAGERERDKADIQQPHTLLCVDAVPLFHSFILPPMMTCAFELVEELCDESTRECASKADGEDRRRLAGAEKGRTRREGKAEREHSEGALQIIGYYHCNLVTPAVDAVPQPSTVAAMAATAVHAKYPQAILCMLHMRRLTAGSPKTEAVEARGTAAHAACVYRMQSERWQLLKEAEQVMLTDAANYVAQSVIRDATYMSLTDMDDHLYDPTLSPSNLSLLTGYEELLEKDREELRNAGVNISDEDVGLAGLSE
ncbi:family UPF0172 protein [Toxoplasma gondii RUB]|uniref:Family UPF0172 protein n=1 Tax=Toxoplasma gondii RUB TaxID=935652 RepID=A0A086M5Z4_TOXGO|nr:family UPF0172 protein [Toxoplasma gondii RUB]